MSTPSQRPGALPVPAGVGEPQPAAPEALVVEELHLATRLSDVYLTTPSEPLTAAQVHYWYQDLSVVRGDQHLNRLELGLRRAHRGGPYRAFLMGHSGSGKSTELTQLCLRVGERFEPLRLSVTQELDPSEFQPFDVLLVSLIEVVKRTTALLGGRVPANFCEVPLRRVLDWMAQGETVREQVAEAQAGAEVGVGLSSASWLSRFLGMSASVKGEARFAASRSRRVTEYRLTRLSELLDAANAVLQEADAALLAATGRQWLLIWEDFDKAQVASSRVKDCFFNYGQVWDGLRCNLLVTVPISLNYAEGGARLPLRPEQRFVIPDPAPFTPSKQPDSEGRAALCAILHRRVDPALLAPGQAEALVVASGGNLRDLLSLVRRAAETAWLRGGDETQIGPTDVEDARTWLRNEYKLRLGESPHDPEPVPFRDKLARLLAVYHGEPGSFVPDRVLGALLAMHAVQEFNHQRWLGVHPLMVDILQDLGALAGPTPPAGGTRA